MSKPGSRAPDIYKLFFSFAAFTIVTQVPDYTLIKQIYEGNVSTLWRATSPDGDPCILKVLRTPFPNKRQLQSIRREFELSEQLGVLEPRRMLLDYNSSLALRLDVQGITLQEWIEQGQLGLKDALRVLAQMCDILKPLHDLGLVHGNLQPAHWLWNIEERQLYLINLGRAWASPRPIVTTNLLDLQYIAPEQTGRMTNQEVDARADLYALGAMLFECLEGKPAHTGRSAMAVISSHVAHPTPGLSQTTPPIVESLIQRLLEKDCSARYQSIDGLAHDVAALQDALCKRQLNDPFELGQQDIRAVLDLDRDFHGHPRAMGQLLRAFADSLEAQCQLVFVKGAQGIGKTRILRALQSTLIEEDVIFLNSRFAGHSQKPYGVLVDIIRQFTHQTLMRDTETIEFWKRRVLQGAQGHAAVLTNAVPEMALIIGEQPPLTYQREEEALHVLHETMSGVVQSIVTKTHPFVLCLDDVHMADLASLKLMIRLLNVLKHQPILVVAASDSDTWEFSPSVQNVLSGLDVQLTVLTLELMTPETLTTWLALTLQRPEEAVRPLAAVGHAYTHGHPQLFAEWIQDLHTQDLIHFDPQYKQWRWQQDAIRAKVEQVPIDALIQMRYKRMPDAIKQVLGVAACFVEEINIEIVQHILELTTLNLHTILTTTQDAGILSRHATQMSTNTRWTFTHKTVQRNIESSLSLHTRTLYHLRIGRAFEQQHANINEHIHAIVYHLNLAKDLLSPEEQIELLALNVQAGKKVRQATVYDRAVEHFEQASPLLTPLVWSAHRTLGLTFLSEAIQASIAAQDYERAQTWNLLYKAHAQSNEEHTLCSALQIDIFFGQMKNKEGIDTALEALELLGFQFPNAPSYLSVATESVKLQTQLFGTSDSALLDAPEMTDATAKQAMSIMYAVISAAYISNENIALLFVLKMVSLSRQYGVSAETPLAYASFGYLLSSTLNQIERGYRFGKIALSLANTYTTGGYKAYTELCVYNYIAPWKDPAAQQIEPLFDAYRTARDAGNHECACFCLLDRLKHAWFAGRSVDKLRDSLEQMKLYAEQTRMLYMQSIYEPWFALFDAVQNNENLTLSTDVAPYPQIQHWLDHNTRLTTLIYATYFHDLELARECLEKIQRSKRQIVNVMEMSTVHLLSGLYHARCAKRLAGLERQTHLAKLLIHIGRLKHWSLYAAHNHKHRLILLEAEYAKLTDRPRKAARNYDESIRLAIEHDFYAEAALAAERACRFYHARHQNSTATRYLEICSTFYTQAGYHSKDTQLQIEYHELVPDHTPTPSGQLHREPLDTQALIHAMSVLSGEVVLERLISKLLGIVIEHSGAQRAVVILRREDNALVVAQEERFGDHPGTLKPNQRIDDITSDLATGLVQYAARTKETVVLDNASQSMQFFSDPYIKNSAPRSLLCLPIMRQERLLALVYLENSLTEGAFTHSKQEILHLLSSHIAISLENAMLYETLEQKVQARTLELEDALQALESAATRDYLTGIYNRLKFTEIAHSIFKTTGDHSLIVLDLDRFKQVNDIHGHKVGDDVLVHITNLISEKLEDTHTLARWGGEEFVILLPDTTQPVAEDIANTLRDHICNHPQTHAGVITFSAGVAQFEPGESLDQLIHRADTALYEAKNGGRNKVIGYPQSD